MLKQLLKLTESIDKDNTIKIYPDKQPAGPIATGNGLVERAWDEPILLFISYKDMTNEEKKFQDVNSAKNYVIKQLQTRDQFERPVHAEIQDLNNDSKVLASWNSKNGWSESVSEKMVNGPWGPVNLIDDEEMEESLNESTTAHLEIAFSTPEESGYDSRLVKEFKNISKEDALKQAKKEIDIKSVYTKGDSMFAKVAWDGSWDGYDPMVRIGETEDILNTIGADSSDDAEWELKNNWYKYEDIFFFDIEEDVEDYEESLEETNESLDDHIITKREVEAARMLMKHSKTPNDIVKAQKVLKKYKEQQKEFEQQEEQPEELTEAKADQQKFIDKFGQANFDKFKQYSQRLKNKNISTDILWHVKNTSKEDMDSIINDLDNTLSKTQKAKEDVVNGADLIYKDDNWKVYHVHTYDAAKKLGSGTTWCITGRYNGFENRGKSYFNSYIRDYNLDDYYFIFDLNNRDPKTGDYLKYCAGVNKNGRRLSFLYNGMQDKEISGTGIPGVPKENRIQPIQGVTLPYDNSVLINGVLIRDDKIVSTKEAHGDIVIPDYVTEIKARTFSNCGELISVVLPDTIKVIPKECFFGCSKLRSVNLNNIEVIEEDAFTACDSFEKITIPSNVRKIDQGFRFCDGLKEVELSEGVSDLLRAFDYCPHLEVLKLPSTIRTFTIDNRNSIRELIYNGSREEWSSIRTNYNGPITFLKDSTNENLDEKIVKKGSEYEVQSEKGRNMGRYKTKKEAEDRLNQIEMFKHMKESWFDDDQFFTRDDLAEYVESPIEEEFEDMDSFFLKRAYIEPGNSLEVDWEYGGIEETSKVIIDMRSIRKQSDLNKYTAELIKIIDSRINEIIDEYGLDESLNEATKLELIKSNKARYAKLENIIKTMKDGVDKDIATKLGLRWIKGRNWEGGLGNSKANNQLLFDIADKYGISADDVYDKFENDFISNDKYGIWESLEESLNEDYAVGNLYGKTAVSQGKEKFAIKSYGVTINDDPADKKFGAVSGAKKVIISGDRDKIINLFNDLYMTPEDQINWCQWDGTALDKPNSLEKAHKALVKQHKNDDKQQLLKDPEFKKYYDKFKDEIYHSIIYLDKNVSSDIKNIKSKGLDVRPITWRAKDRDYFSQGDKKLAVVSGTWDNIISLFKERGEPVRWCDKGGQPFNEFVTVTSPYDMAMAYMKIDAPKGYNYEDEFMGESVEPATDYTDKNVHIVTNDGKEYNAKCLHQMPKYIIIKDKDSNSRKIMFDNIRILRLAKRGEIKEDYDTDRYEYIKSKTVMDRDGFNTDYTMYYDKDLERYVFVFGDNELYGPGDGIDWECDSESEAEDWFKNYKGFDDEEEDDWELNYIDIDEDYDSDGSYEQELHYDPENYTNEELKSIVKEIESKLDPEVQVYAEEARKFDFPSDRKENIKLEIYDGLKFGKVSKEELINIVNDVLKSHGTELTFISSSKDNYLFAGFSLKSMNEAVEVHSELNSKLWGEDKELIPEVKEKIQDTVDHFIENLKEDNIDINVKDIVIVGSNANYNYTDNSDIDVHIVADLSDDVDKDDLLEKIYNAYRKLFNDKYDIKVNGHEIELYIEPNEIKANSNGAYSLNTGWLKTPEAIEEPNIDEEELNKKVEEYKTKINNLLDSSEKIEEASIMNKVTKFHRTPYGFSEANYRGFTITWYDDYVPYGNYDEPYSVDWFGDESFYETVADAKKDIDKYIEETGSDLEESISDNKKLADVNQLIDELYVMRQDSIMKDGEFGLGNLVFKELRNQGLIQKLKDLKTKIEEDELSLK